MPLTPINVIDVTQAPYNAAGDGVTDDTAAIQAAVTDAVSQIYQSVTPPVIAIFTSPKLYFPPGKYKISDTITFGAGQTCLTVIGDDAIIIPDSNFPAAKYAFATDHCYDFRIKGVHFVHFIKGLYIGSVDNVNTSQVSVEECTFLSNTEALRLESISTIVTILKCKFHHNKTAMYLSADKVIVRDCWIQSGEMENISHPAQIVNQSVLTFDSNLLVPETPSGLIEPAWINNYQTVYVSNTRQGGEENSFTLINNFAGSVPPVSNPNGLLPFSISVKDSECFAIYGNDSENGILHPAVVRYVTKMPNSTIIRNNIGLIDCRLVDFSYDKYYKPGHLDNIEDVFANSGAAIPAHSFIEIANNAGGIRYGHNSYVPQILYPFIRDAESTWPSSPAPTSLQPVGPADTSVPGFTIYKFEYTDPRETLLLKYSGNPHPGSAHYSGGYTALLRSNGTYVNGQVQQALRLHETSNEIGSPGTFFAGTYDVSVYWDASAGTASPELLPDVGVEYNPNRFFYVKISNPNQGYLEFDRLKLIRLDKL